MATQEQQAEVEVLSSSSLCQSFPTMPNDLVNRENLLYLIKNSFKEDITIVLLEGDEGLGKTTLLAQFVDKFQDSCISLFITATRKINYDLQTVMFDLANQIHWYLENKELEIVDLMDKNKLNFLLFRLRKKLLQEKKNIYFVIDGLLDIPDQGSRNAILELLPIDWKGLKFILSAEKYESKSGLFIDGTWKVTTIPAFSIFELEHYFKEYGIDKGYLKELYDTFKGTPSSCASIKRLINAGMDINDIFTNIPTSLNKLFEVEWKKVLQCNSKINEILSYVAFNERDSRIDDICFVLQCKWEDIKSDIEKLTFIETKEKNTLSYVSNSFRQFAKKVLDSYKSNASDFFIKRYSREENGQEALVELPRLYNEKKEYQSVLDFLDVRNFQLLVDRCQSLAPLCENADLGILASEELQKRSDNLKYTIQKTTLMSLGECSVIVSEIEALLATNNYDQAIKLALGSKLKENKLYLLCVIAENIRNQGLSPEQFLIEQIENLYQQIDASLLGDKSLKIAGALIGINPKLALELINKANSTKREKKDFDLTLMALSVKDAIINDKSNDQNQNNELMDIKTQINDPNLTLFTTAASIVLSEYNADKVLDEINKIESVRNKIFILSMWTKENTHSPSALSIIDFAIDLIEKTTSYTPTATLLMKLCLPLPHIVVSDELLKSTKNIQAIASTVEKYGPTEDYVSLRLIITATLSKFDYTESKKDLMEIYFYVAEIKGLATRAACLGKLYAFFMIYQFRQEIETDEGVVSIVDSEFDETVTSLLNNSASHYECTTSIISSIVNQSPSRAISIISFLNTEQRRDAAFITYIRNINFDYFNRELADQTLFTLKQFSSMSAECHAFLTFFNKLKIFKRIDENLIDLIIPILKQSLTLKDPIAICKCNSIFLETLIKCNLTGQFSNLVQEITDGFKAHWDSIDVEWYKLEVGFQIVKSLALHSNEACSSFLAEVKKHKESCSISDEELAITYLHCVRLLIKSYLGAHDNHNDFSDSITKLEKVINIVPSLGEQAGVWAELSVRSYFAGFEKLSKHIAQNYVFTCCDGINKKDFLYWCDVVSYCFPSMYLAQFHSAFEILNKLPREHTNKSIKNTIVTILRKIPFSEPFEENQTHEYKLSYEEIHSIFQLLERASEDSLIFDTLERLTVSILKLKKAKKLNQLQSTVIASKYQEIINTKFPDVNNIKHKGYVIASKSLLYKLSKKTPQEWGALIQEARTIPNQSDKCLVLAIISINLPAKHSTLATQTAEEAISQTSLIDDDLDKVLRLESFSSMFLDLDKNISRACMKRVIELAKESKTQKMHEAKKRIIDLAYKSDSKLAEYLSILADDDPARNKNGNQAKDQLKENDFRKSLVQSIFDRAEFPDISEDLERLPSAFWKIWGSLNSKRVLPVHFLQLKSSISLISKLPLSKSYPIISFVIENISKRVQSDDNQIIKTLHAAFYSGLEMCLTIADNKMSSNFPSSMCQISSDNNRIFISAGERDKGFEYIKSWLRSIESNDFLICDPYFTHTDLEIIQLMQSVKPDCEVQIITALRYHEDSSVKTPYDETYNQHWRVKISDTNPPTVEVFIVGTEGANDFPIHDRWMLSGETGLKLGTSFNSLGSGKLSEINLLDQDATKSAREQLLPYINRSTKLYKGARLIFKSFSLY